MVRTEMQDSSDWMGRQWTELLASVPGLEVGCNSWALCLTSLQPLSHCQGLVPYE